MKILLTVLCALVIGASSSALLGREKCTYGPSYWCSSLPNAKTCGAVKHCIKAVWEKQHVPEDTDSICKICLDMVTQARDQLQSNETQEELKEVFEGSCNLIPIKIVSKECRVMVDNFIPELVEALSSEMNPQVVCSTAGLCNNARIDKLLEEYEASKKPTNELSCDQCNNIGNVISHKFHTSSRDQVLDGFLAACGRMSSFSDACSSSVLSYFNEIYGQLSRNLNSENICHLSGVCSAQFHQHDDSSSVEIEPKSNVGFLKNKQAGDDIPCELCEQLVNHLRDLLVANTTELEFKQVLEGLCKQTKAFKDECVTLVDQYYPIIYDSLVNELDANAACFMIGVCPKGSNPSGVPTLPMLPVDQKLPKRKLGVNEQMIALGPLPIDQLMGAKSSQSLVDGGEWCTICQYFLHFIQEELSDAKNEDEIKEAVGRTCDKFPNSIRGNCHNFINLYGDAIIALLVQEVDPREICPQLKMCPSNVPDAELIAPEMDVTVNEEAKPTCPLCVLVVKEAEDYIKNDKSKDSVKKALDRVCSRLPPKPQMQCKDFIESYYDELLEKLVSDFEPKDICTELKLCPSLIGSMTDDFYKVGIEKAGKIPYIGSGDIDTNEIPDFTINGQPIDVQETVQSGECMLCVEVVGGAEHKISSGMKKEQVQNILLRECSRFRAYEGVCDDFVRQNTDKIIELMAKQMAPKQICQQLVLCAVKPLDLEIDEAIIVNVVAVPAFPHKLARVPVSRIAPVADDPQCVVCEFIMTKLEAELKDKTTRDEIRTAVENICNVMPKSIATQCNKFVEQYADLIIELIDTVPPKEVCSQMGLCPAQKKEAKAAPVADDPQCVICEYIMTQLEVELKDKTTRDEIRTAVENICNVMPKSIATKCNKFMEQYADLIIELIDTVPPKQVCSQMGLCPAKKKEAKLLGASECTWGPTHFCSDHKIAETCKATKYCQDRKLGKFA